MELNKTQFKPLSEIFGDLVNRDDMRLAVMLVKRALSFYVSEDEVPDYTLEQVLPADVLTNLPIKNLVQECLAKIRAENGIMAVKQTVKQAMIDAQQAAKSQLVAKHGERDQAVWNIKRALYVDGNKLPAAPPVDD